MLGVSRAVGETMIVVMAAGLAANLTFNPFEAVTTFTVQIKTILVGDQEFDSAKTLSAFALGFVLFFFTLMLNFIALARRAEDIGNSMTDITAPRNATATRTMQSDAAMVRRRYAAERRFKAYGVIAIAVTAVFLVVLFADILRKGIPAFTEHTLGLSIMADQAALDPQGTRDPKAMLSADYDALIRDKLRGLVSERHIARRPQGAERPVEFGRGR